MLYYIDVMMMMNYKVAVYDIPMSVSVSIHVQVPSSQNEY
jgi:hypothetical protein